MRVCLCVSNCVWSRNLNNEPVWARIGLLFHRKKNPVNNTPKDSHCPGRHIMKCYKFTLNFQQPTLRHVSEDVNIHRYLCEKLKCPIWLETSTPSHVQNCRNSNKPRFIAGHIGTLIPDGWNQQIVVSRGSPVFVRVFPLLIKSVLIIIYDLRHWEF